MYIRIICAYKSYIKSWGLPDVYYCIEVNLLAVCKQSVCSISLLLLVLLWGLHKGTQS